MVTMVGTQDSIIDVLSELTELDYDAVEAYDAAINRIDNQVYRLKLEEFREDHLRHTRELSALLHERGETPPAGPSMKQFLTEGKVVLMGLMGDKAIITAMRSNEEDTNTAYERAVNHAEATPEMLEVLRRGLADERRHREWMIAVLNTL